MRRPKRRKQLPSGKGCYRNFADQLICVGDTVAYPTFWQHRPQMRVGVVEDLDREWINPLTGETEPRLLVRAIVASEGGTPGKKATWIYARRGVRVNCPYGREELIS